MAQPEIPGTDVGKVVMPYGSDGNKWTALLVDALGRLQVDAEVDNFPADPATQTTLNALLTELKLKADLLDTQPVSLASLPTGAATIADGSDVALGALADALVAAGAVGSVSGKLRRLTTDLDALLTELKLKADLTETQPVESKDGDKIFSFESIVEQGLVNNSLSTGTNVLEGTAVGGTKVWKITTASIIYSGTTPSSIRIFVDGLANDVILFFKTSPADGVWYPWNGEVYLQVGDKMVGQVNGATATDDLEFRYAGVRMNAP